MNPKRRKNILAGVLVLLLAVLGFRMLGSVLSGGPATPLLGTSAGRSRAETTFTEVHELRLADLELEAGEFRIGRDPFRFAAAKPKRKPRAKAKRREPAPVQEVAAPQPRVAGKPQPPPVDVVFLGSFGPYGGRIAVFSDGAEIYNVREGGILKEDFQVDKIGYESADLRFVNFPEEPSKRLAAGG